MLYQALLVTCGGALGALLRFIITKLFTYSNPVFTHITLINILGCLVAGVLAGYFDKHMAPESLRLFFITGVLGGFTTFSAFSLDVLNLMNKSKNTEAIIYILISVIVSILAAFIGYLLVSR